MMSSAPNPDAEIADLRAALAEERAALAEERAARTRAEAEIEHLKLLIAKLRRERYGQSSERGRHLLDQLELQLEEMETAAGENASQGEADDGDTTVRAFTRRKPKRAPLPADLPRERVVLPSPEACSCCGGGDLVKLGEDVTETLEVVPRQWKVVQTVREKFSCRACEAITQLPAPHHAIARGRAGPSLLAMIVCDKFAMHLPLTRQSRAFAAEGIALDVSTLADGVGRACATLAPLQERIRAHVLGAERLHGDDTTVPVLARKKTVTGRIWTYVRDDRPFGGSDPPAALFHYSRDRGGTHPRGHLAEWRWSRGEARWLGPYGHHSVSSPRSSNRTCGFPASGFPTGFTSRHTAVGQDGPDFVGSHRAPRTRPYRGNLVPRDDTLWRLTRK